MEHWQDLYIELAERISEKLPEIRWIDLWHNQVGFLADEHPFGTPAVFIGFRSAQINDIGELVQIVDLQVRHFPRGLQPTRSIGIYQELRRSFW